MNTEALDALAARWRAEAERFRELGLEQPAVMSETHARELEAAVRAWSSEALTLEQAAEESGFSYSHLQHAVNDGAIPNAGETGRPRIARCDLPRKAGRPGPRLRTETGDPDLAGEVLAGRLEGP